MSTATSSFCPAAALSSAFVASPAFSLPSSVLGRGPSSLVVSSVSAVYVPLDVAYSVVVGVNGSLGLSGGTSPEVEDLSLPEIFMPYPPISAYFSLS